MKIAKEFNWEMGHRLTFHAGKCRNLHGHSYKCMIELEGDTDPNGMVLDYYDLKIIADPVIDELDHSFMVCSRDRELIDALVKLGSKHTVVDFESTAENLCGYIIGRLASSGLPANIRRLKVRVLETENSYAEQELELAAR